MQRTDNLHISGMKPLLSPCELKSELTMGETSNSVVIESRDTVRTIIAKRDKRLLAIVGPCSIHDTASSLEYAGRLKELAAKVSDSIYVIMRTYFEKPRTTIGWRGLITDPHIDGSYDIETGLRRARSLLLDITAMGVPCGSEMLDPIVPQYIADLISWASIGARTTESQTHREMASGLSMPVGFKNSTSGEFGVAINALNASRHPHSFIGIDQNGMTSVVSTTGNEASHIILRGGTASPNYYEETVEAVEKSIFSIGIDPAIVIDCSHANSGKQYVRQKRDCRIHDREPSQGGGAESSRGRVRFRLRTIDYGRMRGVGGNGADAPPCERYSRAPLIPYSEDFRSTGTVRSTSPRRSTNESAAGDHRTDYSVTCVTRKTPSVI
jgi:3-deoxy-7-phosphoheptulonate synthase